MTWECLKTRQFDRIGTFMGLHADRHREITPFFNILGYFSVNEFFRQPVRVWHNFTSRQPASDQQLRNELKQAKVRAPLIGIVLLYTVISSMIVTKTFSIEPWATHLLIFYAGYALFAALIFLSALKYPGHYPARRILGMCCDYFAVGYTIFSGCTVMLPMYVFIVWITLGNGLRYGPRYLLAASVLGQVTLLIVFLETPHWRTDPIVALTLSITALIVPAYAYSLLRAKERAEQATKDAIATKSWFLAQASHDLRQPIHAMNLYLNSLQQTSLSDGQTVLVDRMDRSLDGIASLFKSLLDISSIDGGGVKPSAEPICANQLFAEIRQQFSTAQNELNTHIRFVRSRRWLHADPMLLQTIVQNLVGNALKHAPGSRILVGCRKLNGRVSIMVSDQGPGISKDHIPQLFSEFYQVKKWGQADGNGVGLGLSIVERLSTLMNLVPEIRSEEGKGTTVYIHGLEEITASTSMIRPFLASPVHFRPLQNLRVVLVEDDPDLLSVTSELLRSWGCMVNASTTIPSAPGVCDLVVTDLDIGGGMTGLDVIAEVRAANGRDVPAIIVTGHDGNTRHRLENDDDHLWLSKPLKAAELRSAISTMRVSV